MQKKLAIYQKRVNVKLTFTKTLGLNFMISKLTKLLIGLGFLSGSAFAQGSVVANVTGDVNICCSIDNLPSALQIGGGNALSSRGGTIEEQAFDISCNANPLYKITAQNGYLKHKTFTGTPGSKFVDTIDYQVSLDVGGAPVIPQSSIKGDPTLGVQSSNAVIPYDTSAIFRLRVPFSPKFRLSGTYEDVLTITISGS